MIALGGSCNFNTMAMIYIIGFSGNPHEDTIKGILGDDETHWSRSMAGNHTFWLTITAAVRTSSWGKVHGPLRHWFLGL